MSLLQKEYHLSDILFKNPNFDDAPVPPAPDKEYVIFFIGRSGSSHLTDLLESADVGAPREWLNPDFLPAQAEFFKARTFDQYFGRMKAWFARQGVFGHEMTIWMYEIFSEEVCLENYFNFASPSVFLFRENIVEQAVSVMFADRRNVFHATPDVDTGQLMPVNYDEDEIRYWVQHINTLEGCYKDFVISRAIRPKFLTYESLISADPIDLVKAFGNLVGVEPKTDKVSSMHRKIGTAVNADYASRFTKENGLFMETITQSRQWLFDGLDANPLL